MVVGPAPELSAQRKAARERCVRVRECIWFERASGRPTRTSEHADIRNDLLLQIAGDSSLGRVRAHCSYIRRSPGQLRKLCSSVKVSHTGAREIARHCDLSWLAPQIIPPLDFTDQLELTECRVQSSSVWENGG